MRILQSIKQQHLALMLPPLLRWALDQALVAASACRCACG
jgi:hypothetical protein